MASITNTKFEMQDTPKGVRIDLQLYYYPATHANIVDSKNNFPVANDVELIGHFVSMLDQAKRRMRARGFTGIA